MISIGLALSIHEIVINEFGGSNGIRDRNLLESALARPFQTFDGTDLYPTPFDKASAILESVLINHPFIDGNKRTAFMLMSLILTESGITIIASQDEIYDFIINIIKSKPSTSEISDWIRLNSSKNE